MALCPGKRGNGRNCSGTVYRCKNCGSVGCENRDCSNQKFEILKCLSCGKFRTKEQQR